MYKIIDYQIIQKETLASLENDVRNFIVENWQPYHAIFYHEENKVWCQAMIKYEGIEMWNKTN